GPRLVVALRDGAGGRLRRHARGSRRPTRAATSAGVGSGAGDAGAPHRPRRVYLLERTALLLRDADRPAVRPARRSLQRRRGVPAGRPGAGARHAGAAAGAAARPGQGQRSSLLITRPDFITQTTRRSARMSRDGSPSTAIRSAS